MALLEKRNDGSYRIHQTLFSYLETALWSSTYLGAEDDPREGKPLDDYYDPDDFLPAFLESSARELQSFLDWISEDGIDVGGNSDAGIAHDFWLTRNRHGCGFWDGDYPDGGKALSNNAHAYGGIDLMPGEHLPMLESDDE